LQALPWRRFAALGLLIVLDLWSKQAIFAWLDGDAPPELVRDAHGHMRLPLVGDWLALMTSENPGAAFGRFGEWPRLLVLGRSAAAVVLLVMLWRARPAEKLKFTAILLVSAGALGNLYDNLFRTPSGTRPFGSVRDFIDVYFASWDWHFPTFNVADSCITLGAVAFLLHGFFVREEPHAALQRAG
jgi:lipoprotein signal peptidase